MSIEPAGGPKGPIEIHRLENGAFSAEVCDLGAGVVGFSGPDRNGEAANVVLHYPRPEDALSSGAYFGLTVGRFANRIAKGRFSLGSEVRILVINDGPNHLHGGPTGMAFQVWKSRAFEQDGDPGVEFSLSEPDGREGYPGALEARASYVLKADGSLVIRHRATVDRPCPLSLTNHSYFNLDGEGSGRTVMGTVLRIASPAYLPVDGDLLPTGEVRPSKGGPFDFVRPKEIGCDFALTGGGYDHCFVLEEGRGLRLAAEAFSPASGRILKVWTTMPAIQFYAGNALHNESYYPDHTGFCLETEYYPDSPNHPDFPSCLLRPGEVYDQTTVYQLSAEGL